MQANMVTAEYDAIFPYDVLMNEAVTEAITYEWPGLGKALIYAPELVDIKKLREGHYGSKQRIDVTLDIKQIPTTSKLDSFFAEKCITVLSSFLLEVWFHTKAPQVDPLLQPIYITCKYYDSTGSPYINPDTGKSSYEAQLPRGVILSKTSWNEIAANLSSGKPRDWAETVLLSARSMRYVNRPEMAILLSAIACEYKVKHLCDLLAKRSKVPQNLWHTIEKLHLRFTEYQDIMRSLGIASMKRSPDNKIRALPKRLETLLGHRNIIAHRGTIQGYKGKIYDSKEFFSLTDADIETAEQFVSLLDVQQAAIK